MRDVAATAGVSLKTVSRVVNCEPGVGAETLARVTGAIELLGFRRNDLARSLRPGQRTSTVGLVIGDVGNPFFAAIARAVERVARAAGSVVITGSTYEDPAHEKDLVATLCARRVDGMLVVPAGRDHTHLLAEQAAGTAMVLVDRDPRGMRADAVVLDNAGGARHAVDHLLARGHRRVAVLADTVALPTGEARVAGYREALGAAGLDVDARLVRVDLDGPAGAARATEDLLALDEPPSAVFTVNNRMSLGALRALHRHERQPALVGFDDFELADMLVPPLSVVRSDPETMGAVAASLLFDRLAGDAAPYRRIVLPATLVARGSGEVGP